MNLVAHHVAENGNWLDTADELKNWGILFLSEEDWEVPPPLWAITREKNSEEYRSWWEVEKLKELKEKKENEKAEESLVTSSPLDPDWGIWTTCTSFFQRRNSRFESQFRTRNTIYTL